MAKALYNPKDGALIKGFVWSHARWDLKINEMKKFPDDVGAALLKHFEFLVEVTPKNVKKIEDGITAKDFKCPNCESSFTSRIALTGHTRTHALSEAEKTMLDGIPEAESKGEYKKPTKPGIMSPSETEGIPKGGTLQSPSADKDGVPWYGAGDEDDKPS